MLLRGIAQRRRAARAEERLRQAPSPEAYLDLARLYLAQGAGERALATLQEARTAFPDDENLRAFHDETHWSHLRQRARTLQQRIDVRPQAADVVALAAVYCQVGDLARALDLLKRAADQFTGDLEVHLALARLRRRAWQTDFLAADGLDAVAQYAAVLALDPQHVEALGALAELHLEVGAFEEAHTHLERLGALPPAALDQPARERFERFAAFVREGRGRRQPPNDLEALFDAVEVSRAPLVHLEQIERDDQALPPAAADQTSLRTRVLDAAQHLARESDVRAVLVQDRAVDPAVLSLTGPEGDRTTEQALAAVMAAAALACQRLEIGRLQQLTVSSPTGTLAAVGFPDEVLVCLCGRTWQAGRAEARLLHAAERLRQPQGAPPCDAF